MGRARLFGASVLDVGVLGLHASTARLYIERVASSTTVPYGGRGREREFFPPRLQRRKCSLYPVVPLERICTVPSRERCY